jgi:predicted DNA-binding WGR domain protein
MTAVQLRRLDPAKNLARFYLLDVQQDLFGQWWLVREFGRIGSPGRVMQKPYRTVGSTFGIDLCGMPHAA